MGHPVPMRQVRLQDEVYELLLRKQQSMKFKITIPAMVNGILKYQLFKRFTPEERKKQA